MDEGTYLISVDGDPAGCLEEAAFEIIRRIPKLTNKGALFPRPMFNDNQAEMLVRRLGIDGRPASTLQEAADLKGVSRERLRQLQVMVDQWIESSPAQPDHLLPSVILATAELASTVPSSSLPVRLRDLGIAQGDWPLERVVDLLHLCGRNDLDEEFSSFTAREETLSLMRNQVTHAVWEESGRSGFAQLKAVRERLRSQLPGLASTTSDDELTELICATEGVFELPHGYLFGAPHGDPTIVETAKRMLQVSDELPLRVVRSGLRRRCKFRQIPFKLPLDALRAFFELHPHFKIDAEDNVRAHCSPATIHQETLQRWIVNEIRASDYGMLTRHQVMQRARAERNNTNSIGIYLTYGEQIAHDRRGFFYAVGDSPAEEVVDVALEVADATVRNTSQSWHYDASANTLTGLIELGDSALAGGVVFADAQSQGYLDLLLGHRYRIVDENGHRFGNLTVSETMRALTGLSTLFAHTFPEPGDLLKLEIDLIGQLVHAEVGGSELDVE